MNSVVECNVVVVKSVMEVVPFDEGATSVEVVDGAAEDVDVKGDKHSGTLKGQSHHCFSGL